MCLCLVYRSDGVLLSENVSAAAHTDLHEAKHPLNTKHRTTDESIPAMPEFVCFARRAHESLKGEEDVSLSEMQNEELNKVSSKEALVYIRACCLFFRLFE